MHDETALPSIPFHVLQPESVVPEHANSTRSTIWVLCPVANGRACSPPARAIGRHLRFLQPNTVVKRRCKGAPARSTQEHLVPFVYLAEAKQLALVPDLTSKAAA